MVIGKPVSGTGNPGNVDLMNVDNSYLVDYSSDRVGPDCEVYPSDAGWAEPSVEYLAALSSANAEHVVSS